MSVSTTYTGIRKLLSQHIQHNHSITFVTYSQTLRKIRIPLPVRLPHTLQTTANNIHRRLHTGPVSPTRDHLHTIHNSSSSNNNTTLSSFPRKMLSIRSKTIQLQRAFKICHISHNFRTLAVAAVFRAHFNRFNHSRQWHRFWRRRNSTKHLINMWRQCKNNTPSK